MKLPSLLSVCLVLSLLPILQAAEPNGHEGDKSRGDAMLREYFRQQTRTAFCRVIDIPCGCTLKDPRRTEAPRQTKRLMFDQLTALILPTNV